MKVDFKISRVNHRLHLSGKNHDRLNLLLELNYNGNTEQPPHDNKSWDQVYYWNFTESDFSKPGSWIRVPYMHNCTECDTQDKGLTKPQWDQKKYTSIQLTDEVVLRTALIISSSGSKSYYEVS